LGLGPHNSTAPRTFPHALRGHHGTTSVYSTCSISRRCTRGGEFEQIGLAREMQTECGPGSTTGKSGEHPRFIMSKIEEGIMLEDSEFMAMRCFDSSCRFSMVNPHV
jgi:hypothetical protein